MNNYGVFDIEANEWVKFELLGCYDGNEYKTFASPKAFVSYINQKKFNGWKWYAHFGGRFDFLFILDHVLNVAVDYKIIPKQGGIISIHVTTSKCKFTIADSYCLLPESLSKLTHGFNVEHKKLDFAFIEGTVLDAKDKDLQKYLKNDCIGLYEVLTAFFESDYCVHPKLTIASQALDTFRSIFCKSELTQIRCEDRFRDLFYSGGRVEVYKQMGRVHYYDVNSLYPFAMLEEQPCGDMKHVGTYQQGKIGFYSVNIKSTPDFYITPLLVKCSPKKNYYCNGKGTYFLSSATLDYIRKEFGIKFTVNYGYVFPKRRALFNEFVETFYKLKREAKGTGRYMIAKYMLNSLYGKLGQSRWKQSVGQWTGDDSQGRTTPLAGAEDWGTVLIDEKSRSKYILPYLASYITECARLHHFKLMNANSNQHFYCDTDSILSGSTRTLASKTGTELGKLTCEGTYDGIFLASKCYALREVGTGVERVKFKGFANKKFTYSDFKEALLKGKTLMMEETKVLSWLECLKLESMKGKTKRKIVNNEGKFLKTQAVVKIMKVTYDRRRLIEHDSFVHDSVPFDYSEIENVQT